MIKLVIDLPAGHSPTAEQLWAHKIDDVHFRIANVPIWPYGIAYEDIVEARTEPDGRLHFIRVTEPSGLLTLRVAGPQADAARFERLIGKLQEAAVATERYSKSYAAFAIKPERYEQLRDLLGAAESDGTIYVEVANLE
jgi:hypothetical protein